MTRAIQAMPDEWIEREFISRGRAVKRRFKMSKQQQLGRRLGVTQQAISAWEARGWAPIHRCDEISQITGVPARDLMNPRDRAMLEQVAAA